jgi:protein tyrosine/serine phosphatase
VSEYEVETGIAPTGKILGRHPLILKVDDRGLFRGPNPGAFLEILQGMGITKIINLQEGWWDMLDFKNYDVDIRAREHNMLVIHEPMRNFSFVKEAQVDRILKEIRGSLDQKQKIYIHCRRGKDRTGLICGLWRVLEHGLSIDEAIDEWRSLGHSRFYKLLKWEPKFIEAVMTQIGKGKDVKR